MTQFIKNTFEQEPTPPGLHQESPVTALAKALECLEWDEGAPVATNEC